MKNRLERTVVLVSQGANFVGELHVCDLEARVFFKLSNKFGYLDIRKSSSHFGQHLNQVVGIDLSVIVTIILL